jgi:iron(III) transport system substrate-binding protein
MGVSAHAMLAAALLPALGSVAGAQPAASDKSAIYLYQGADRDQRLAEKARAEGTLTLYTSMATTESAPLALAFEKKYGVKVQLWRALSENVLQRALTEARGGRPAMDVVETNAPEVEALGREQVVSEFFSPRLADLPAWATPPHRRWASDRANLWVVGYNTGKVKRDELPATYEGFADPKWKGRIALEATDSDWMYGVIAFMGIERGVDFFRRLAALKPDLRKGHALLAQLIAAGELPIGLTVYSGNADSIKSKGGPIARRRWPSPGARRTRTRRCCSWISCCPRRARSCSTSSAACPPVGPKRRCSTATSTSWSTRSNGPTRRPGGRSSGASCS